MNWIVRSGDPDPVYPLQSCQDSSLHFQWLNANTFEFNSAQSVSRNTSSRASPFDSHSFTFARSASFGNRQNEDRNNSSSTRSSSFVTWSNFASRPSPERILCAISSPFCKCNNCGIVTSPLRSQAQAVTRSDRPNSVRKYDFNPGSGS